MNITKTHSCSEALPRRTLADSATAPARSSSIGDRKGLAKSMRAQRPSVHARTALHPCVQARQRTRTELCLWTKPAAEAALAESPHVLHRGTASIRKKLPSRTAQALSPPAVAGSSPWPGPGSQSAASPHAPAADPPSPRRKGGTDVDHQMSYARLRRRLQFAIAQRSSLSTLLSATQASARRSRGARKQRLKLAARRSAQSLRLDNRTVAGKRFDLTPGNHEPPRAKAAARSIVSGVGRTPV